MVSTISFLVVGYKGYQTLLYAIDNCREIIEFVVLGKDGGVDDDYHDQILSMCKLNSIPFYERTDSEEIVAQYCGWMFAIGWRWMLPTTPNLIILHDSLLPKHRGFAPLVSCLVCGESKIGATALFASENYDKGEVICQASREIAYPITIKDAIRLMADVYVEIVADILSQIKSKSIIKSAPQDHEAATYSLWRDENDYWVDWNRSAVEIARFIDAVGVPYAGARCLINLEEAVLLSAIPLPDLHIEDRNSAIGKVIFVENNQPVIVCGYGLLKIVNVVDLNGETLLPLSQFRTRFSGRV